MFNSILKSMGKDIVYWYQDNGPWPFILIFVNCWKGVGYGSLIYIAGIAGIDPAFYEAAELDGANKWQQITRITLPCLVPADYHPCPDGDRPYLRFRLRPVLPNPPELRRPVPPLPRPSTPTSTVH